MGRTSVLLLLLALLGIFTPFARAAFESDPQGKRTLSPYFQVLGDENAGVTLPLKNTDVQVKIAGVIADVRVKQTYRNDGQVPLEAIYVFPGSTRAAVHGLEMTVGERVVKAQIQERKAARQTFEEAKAQGKSASLLEQHRPNVFQMNVANILPGDTIQVELRYTELIIPHAGEYEFVFPTVVGPRYSNTPAAGAPETAKWVKNPYLLKDVKTPAAFALQAEIVAGMPLQGLHCATHVLKPEFQGPNRATISLPPDGGHADRDFILKYRLADSRIESGLLLTTGEKENFFLLTVQPPRRVTPAQIPPRDYVFVVDVSGSMSGFSLETSKALLKKLLGQLRAEDSFNVILFAGSSTMLAGNSLPADRSNLQRAFELIDDQRGGGGTELLPALQKALALPNPREAARSIVVVTDGFVDVEPAAFELVRQSLHQANLFAFGIGSSVNRHLIEGLAHVGQGEPFIVTRPEEAEEVSRRLGEYISSPVLTHLQAEFDGFQTYDLEPAALADVLADRPVTFFGKWKGEPRGAIVLRGRAGEGPWEQRFDVAQAAKMEDTSALTYLWARSRIATLGDFHALRPSDERVQAITNLGLTYHLLTAYTSFIAVNEVVRNPGGQQLAVKQPSPLPQGVENSAVGVSVSSSTAPISTTPEPGTFLLLLVAAAALCIFRWRTVQCA